MFQRLLTAAAATLTMLLPSIAVPARQALQVAPATDRQGILVAVADVRKAIQAQDVEALLASLSRVEPFGCTDSTYSYEEIVAFLRDENSHLYISLFDTPTFAERCGHHYPSEYPAISEREFLRSAGDSVQIARGSGAWITVTLTSPVPTHAPREWDFHWELGTWKLAGRSFIVGNCSCG